MRWQKLIDRIHTLRYITDRKDHHPEENVLIHSLQALNIAKKESKDIDLQAAALLHDIGKNIETLSHEKHSIDILKSFGYMNEKVLWLIENHIRILWFLDGSMQRHSKVQELLNHKWFVDLIHLRRIDYAARKPNKIIDLNPEEINLLLEVTNEH